MVWLSGLVKQKEGRSQVFDKGLRLQLSPSFLFLRKEKKNYARISYRHECEPVIQMFNIASYVVTWGVMPLLGGGLIRVSNLGKVEWVRKCVGYFPIVFTI